MEKAQCLTNGEGVCTNLRFQRKKTPDDRDMLSLGSNRKVQQKLNIQAFEARGAMSSRGSSTPADQHPAVRSGQHSATACSQDHTDKVLHLQLCFMSKEKVDRQTDIIISVVMELAFLTLLRNVMSVMVCRACDPVSALY